MIALRLPERARDRRIATGSLLVVVVLAGLLAWSVSRLGGASRPASAGTRAAPSVVGETIAVAQRRLATAGLRAVELGSFSSKPEGVVLSQDTRTGARVAAGATVALTVSKGAARSSMPVLAGVPAPAAAAKLEALHLAVLRFRVVSDAPVGTVVSTFPAPGAALHYDDPVRLNVSGGIPSGTVLASSVRVPSLVGASGDAAQSRLRALGLTPDLFYVRSTRPAGLVARQSVAARTSARLGALVGLGISLGAHGVVRTPVPYVVGRPLAAGTSLLRSTGFQVRIVDVLAPAGTKPRTVLDEQPMGGTKAPDHAVVTIVIAA